MTYKALRNCLDYTFPRNGGESVAEVGHRGRREKERKKREGGKNLG